MVSVSQFERRVAKSDVCLLSSRCGYFRLVYNVLVVEFPSMGQALGFRQLQFLFSSLCSHLLNRDLLWFDIMVLILGMQL